MISSTEESYEKYREMLLETADTVLGYFCTDAICTDILHIPETHQRARRKEVQELLTKLTKIGYSVSPQKAIILKENAVQDFGDLGEVFIDQLKHAHTKDSMIVFYMT